MKHTPVVEVSSRGEDTYSIRWMFYKEVDITPDVEDDILHVAEVLHPWLVLC